MTKKTSGLSANKIKGLTSHGTVVYAATSNDLNVVENGTVKVETFAPKMLDPSIIDRGLFADAKGNVWIVTSSNIHCRQQDGVYKKLDKDNSPINQLYLRTAVLADDELRVSAESSLTTEPQINTIDEIKVAYSPRFYTFEKELLLKLKVQ
ncbi:MAG: hypothetical protein LBK47_05985 [Prevotellaceae bacterium]|jgi:hypothetical protein|nr:hypothetical protein [Prevotellaceae bacterium]